MSRGLPGLPGQPLLLTLVEHPAKEESCLDVAAMQGLAQHLHGGLHDFSAFSRLAAQPPARCALCAWASCVPRPRQPLCPPRGKQVKSSPHSGLEAAKARFSFSTFPSAALGTHRVPTHPASGGEEGACQPWCGPSGPAGLGPEGRAHCLPAQSSPTCGRILVVKDKVSFRRNTRPVVLVLG